MGTVVCACLAALLIVVVALLLLVLVRTGKWRSILCVMGSVFAVGGIFCC